MAELKQQSKEKNKRSVTLPTQFRVRFWQAADGRLSMIREIRRRVKELQADANADSCQKRIICERAVFLVLQLESLEADAAETGTFTDTGRYANLCNCLLGLLKNIGLEKQAKIANLDSYLKTKERGA